MLLRARTKTWLSVEIYTSNFLFSVPLIVHGSCLYNPCGLHCTVNAKDRTSGAVRGSSLWNNALVTVLHSRLHGLRRNLVAEQNPIVIIRVSFARRSEQPRWLFSPCRRGHSFSCRSAEYPLDVFRDRGSYRRRARVRKTRGRLGGRRERRGENPAASTRRG